MMAVAGLHQGEGWRYGDLLADLQSLVSVCHRLPTYGVATVLRCSRFHVEAEHARGCARQSSGPGGEMWSQISTARSRTSSERYLVAPTTLSIGAGRRSSLASRCRGLPRRPGGWQGPRATVRATCSRPCHRHLAPIGRQRRGTAARARPQCRRPVARRTATVGQPVAASQIAMLADLGRPVAMALDSAIYGKCAGLRIATSSGSKASHEPLTPRQQQVAALVARGQTNRQIAQALGVRPGTVAKHIEHILARLSFESRAQIATRVTAHGVGPQRSDRD
jgi:DNA-binding CsgD family transcriptional regulator